MTYLVSVLPKTMVRGLYTWIAESQAGALSDLMGAMHTLHAMGPQRPFNGIEREAKQGCLYLLRTEYWAQCRAITGGRQGTRATQSRSRHGF